MTLQTLQTTLMDTCGQCTFKTARRWRESLQKLVRGHLKCWIAIRLWTCTILIMTRYEQHIDFYRYFYDNPCPSLMIIVVILLHLTLSIFKAQTVELFVKMLEIAGTAWLSCFCSFPGWSEAEGRGFSCCLWRHSSRNSQTPG